MRYLLLFFIFSGISLTVLGVGVDPTCPASGLSFSNISSSSITVTWTNGCGDSRLVIVKEGGTPCDPTDGTPYVGNSNYGSAPSVSGSGCGGNPSRVVYSSIGNSVTVTGLSSNTNYTFKVVEYNTVLFDYRTIDAPFSSVSTSGGGGGGGGGGGSAPTLQASNITFSNIQTTQLIINVGRGNGDKTLIVGRAGTELTETPAQGVQYCHPSGGSTVVFGTGDALGNGAVTIANVGSGGCGCPSSINGFVLSGLSPGTTYTFRAFEATSNCSPDYNTSTSTGNPASVTTLCAAPATNGYDNTTQSSFDAKWLASSGATKYYIDVSTTSDFQSLLSAYNNLDVGNVTSVAVTGLSAGTTYFFRVRAYNSAGQSANSNTATAVTIPANPSASNPSTITQTSFTASWLTSTGASVYYIDVSTASDFSSFVSGYQNLNTGNNTSASISGLSAGTTYYYRVRSSNASGTSGNSNTITTITIPDSPTLSPASSITQTSFSANWSAVAGVTGYRIDVSEFSDFSTLLTNYSNQDVGNVITRSVSGLNGGLTYYYRIRAYNSSGTSGNSSSLSVTMVPPEPTAIPATLTTQSSFVANWNAAVGAQSYRLDVATSSGFGADIISGYNDLSVSGNSQSVAGLSANTTYYYRVQAVNANGTSGESNIISQLTTTVAPVATMASAIGETSFTANWSAVTGASEYYFDYSADPAFATIIERADNTPITGTSLTISNESSGTTFYYRVRAVNAGGASSYSNVISVLTIPSAPVTSEATFITKNSFIANWAASTGASEYRLDVSTDDFASNLSSYNNLLVNSTSQSVTGLSEGIIYKYRVRAVNATGTSSNSASISVVTVPPVPTAQPATAISLSGFTANWGLVSGATQYLLYVTDANGPLNGYDPKTLTTNSEVLSGLSSNSLYHYSVKATSSSGTSAASSIIDVTTLATAPTSPTVTAITQMGFTANWVAVSGITEYQLDVSQDNFATNVSGYDNLTVSATSKTITGLTPGTSYKFRVRAKNVTGGSANSSSVDALLIPATPVANAATTITASGFTVSWSATPGTSTYVLDVSDKSDFSTFLTGYNQKIIASSTTQEILTALQSGTTYYYRVKSRNASGDSPFSNPVSQITVPGKPVLNIAQQITSSSFQASWPEVTGAASYELDVYTSSDEINITYVTGYQSRSINGTDEVVEGLTASTVYRFRIRAKNAGGVSENSTRLSVQTLTPAGTVENPPTITAGTPTQANSVKAVIAGGTSPWIVTLYHKKITGDTFIAEPPKETTATTVDFNVTDLADELGLEYYFHVVDENAKVGSSPPAKYTVSFEANTRSFVQGDFAGNRSSIKIISIPFVLSNNAVEAVFGALGAYNKKVWRLAHYSNGKNVEFQSPGFPTIERGLGFWFNAKVGSLNLKTTSGNAGPNDSDNPFILNLNEGWNQIGNPYPFAIDWSDVLTDNTAAATGVGGLRKYRGESQNFVGGDDLGVFEGAFVFAESATELKVNVSLKNRFDAGRKSQEEISCDLGGDAWELPIKLRQGQSFLDLAGIGMRPEARISKDRFDDIRLPRLDEYLDVTFEHPEYKFSHFSKDIVPTKEEYTWTFTAESSSALEGITLEWDNSMFGENSAQLFLLDLTDATVVNMRSQNSYTYNGSEKREFRIYYIRSQKEFSPGIYIASAPFPNPARTNVNVNIVLPDAHQRYSVLLQIFDFSGRPVKQIHYSGLQGGMHQLQWNTDSEDVASGTYFLRTTINEKPFGPVKRIIVLD
jgi:hypothetical protein